MDSEMTKILQKHSKLIEKHNRSVYRLLQDYNFKFKIHNNEINIDVKNIRLHTTEKYKRELESIISSHVSEMVSEFLLKYGLNINNIIVEFDKESYE